MTPRYIDAEKLLVDNKEFADREFIHPKFQTTLRDIVNEQPTADVAPVPVVHAHWVYKYKGTSHDDIAYCSRCEFYVEDKINNVGICYHFCPNCGARMDEDVNEDAEIH